MYDIVNCPGCRNPLRIPQARGGKHVRCPGCGHVFQAAEEVVPVLEPVDEPPEVPPLRRALPVGWKEQFSATPLPPAFSVAADAVPEVVRRRVERGRKKARLARPWFLFVLAGLPLGLPLLGLLAHEVAGVDVGLALGVGCGAGLLLAALCLAAVLTPGTVASRTAVAGMLNGVAYFAGFVLLARAVASRDGEEGRKEPQRPAPVAVGKIPAANLDDQDWREFKLPGSDCVVLMPGQPAETPLPGVMGPDILRSRKCLLHILRVDQVFAVAYIDVADWGMRRLGVEQRCDLEAQGVSGAMKGQVVWRGASTLAGRPAHEFRVQVPGQPGTFIERLCAVKRPGCSRLYLVAVAGSPITPGCPIAEKFFGSFRIDTPPPPLQQPPPAREKLPELVGHWPFDEGAGQNCRDLSDRGNNGTAHAAEWVDGVRGKALRLRGSGSYFDYGRSSDFNFAANAPFTLAGWVRTKARDGTIVSQRSSTAGSPVIDILLAGGSIHVDLRDDGNEFGQHVRLGRGPQVDDGRWHHFALTRGAGSRATLFVDGRRVDQGEAPQSGGSITTDLRFVGREGRWLLIGRAQNAHLEGDVDDFRVYHRELSEADVKALAVPAPMAPP